MVSDIIVVSLLKIPIERDDIRSCGDNEQLEFLLEAEDNPTDSSQKPLRLILLQPGDITTPMRD